MMKADVKEQVLALVEEWLQAEDDTIQMTKDIATETENETISLWMYIIRSDSTKHKRILNFIKKSLTKKSAVLSYDEIGAVSEMIKEHLKLEQKTVDLGAELKPKVRLPIEQQLFDLLLTDERKHVKFLEALSSFKDFASRNT
jgi:hypothetical protein